MAPSNAVKATVAGLATTAVVGGAALSPIGDQLIGAAGKLVDKNKDDALVGQGMLVAAAGLGAFTLSKGMSGLLTSFHPRLPAGVQMIGWGLLVAGAYTAVRAPLEHLRTRDHSDGEHIDGYAHAEAISTSPATKIADLEDVRVANAEVILAEADQRSRPGVYLDVTADTVVTGGIHDAISAANTASKQDATNRSHAVVQTLDGALHVVRLGSINKSLDRIDGPHYAADTGYSPHETPVVASRQPGLLAIVGVERVIRLDEPATEAELAELRPGATEPEPTVTIPTGTRNVDDLVGRILSGRSDS